MGGSGEDQEWVMAGDFFWSYTDEPHASRRRQILSKYPQINDLFGPDHSALFKKEIKPHNNNWNNDRSFERLVTQRKQVFLLTDCKTLQAEELQNQMDKNYDIGQARDVKVIKKRLRSKHPNTQVHAVMISGVVLLQLGTATLLRDAGWLKIFLVAYFFGSILNHNLFLAIYELSHNLAFSTPICNCWLGIFANLPIGVSMSIWSFYD